MCIRDRARAAAPPRLPSPVPSVRSARDDATAPPDGAPPTTPPRAGTALELEWQPMEVFEPGRSKALTPHSSPTKPATPGPHGAAAAAAATAEEEEEEEDVQLDSESSGASRSESEASAPPGAGTSPAHPT